MDIRLSHEVDTFLKINNFCKPFFHKLVTDNELIHFPGTPGCIPTPLHRRRLELINQNTSFCVLVESWVGLVSRTSLIPLLFVH